MPIARLGHGVSIPAGLPPDDAFAAGLTAWAEVLPPSAVFTSLTAARAHGLWLPPLPPRTPWFVAMGREKRRVGARAARASRRATGQGSGFGRPSHDGACEPARVRP